MAAKVYCRTTAKGVQTYYLTAGKEDYYLFDADYRKSNKEFFSQGRYIQELLDAKRHNSTSVRRISTRLINAVRYIESEYAICVFQQTAKKQQKKRSNKMFRKSERACAIAV